MKVSSLESSAGCSVGGRKVVINVGGSIFHTFAETFSRCPTSLLATMFADQNKALLQDVPFFDRSAVAFAAILEWFRTGFLVLPSNVAPDMMLTELDFWQIPISVSVFDEDD